jgi:pimeloyl-ACP methyl ester carboxylesterase
MTNTLEFAPISYDEQSRVAEDPMANIEVHDFGRGQIVHYSPLETRADELTGEPVIPLVYFQGINGDNSLPAVMQALGERDKRPVIGIRYVGRLKGSDKPISAKHHDYGEGAIVPEIAAGQADDMLAALDVMGIKKVDMLATSKGGLPWIVAMKKRPELFRNAYGDDVAGQDGRNYGESHIDAVRLVTGQKFQKFVGESILNATTAKPSRNERLKRDLRTEQKAVARAQLHTTLAWLGENTDIAIRLGSDRQDTAFRTKNVRATMAQTGADRNVRLVETDKGGHGIGTNSLAIDNALEQLREMERAEAAESQALRAYK